MRIVLVHMQVYCLKLLRDSHKMVKKLQPILSLNNILSISMESWPPVSTDKFINIALKCCSNLQTLDLSANSICSGGAVALAEGKKCCTNLQKH